MPRDPLGVSLMRCREGTLMKRSNLFRLLLVPSLMLAVAGRTTAQDAHVQITVHWDKIVQESRTSPTLQVVVNPPLRRGTAVHDNAFKALHDLGADYVRYVPRSEERRVGKEWRSRGGQVTRNVKA